jgi:hypothetical protein
MRRVLILIAVPLLLATACRTGQTMWASCDTSGDRTGTDGTYVLLCRDGTWQPLMTAKEYVEIRAGRKITIAPLPTEPTTTTTPATSTTSTTTSSTSTSTSTTTTTVPAPLATLTYSASDGACTSGGNASETLDMCQSSGFTIAQVSHQNATGVCSGMQLPFDDIVDATGTLTQGSTTLNLTFANRNQDSPLLAWWQIPAMTGTPLDVNDGPITFNLDSITFGSGYTCA